MKYWSGFSDEINVYKVILGFWIDVKVSVNHLTEFLKGNKMSECDFKMLLQRGMLSQVFSLFS